MHKIMYKEQLSEEVFLIRADAPLIAQNRKAGQFVIIQIESEYDERIPLTIADANPMEGWIQLIFQTVGATTHKLATLNTGDYIQNILGPLGNPTHIEKVGEVICVGGGIGVAPLYPIAQAFKQAGNKLIIIMGARTKNLLILEKEMKLLADEMIICTDDGSYGRKCLVTEPLKEVCARSSPPNLAVAIGPAIMIKFCCAVTKNFSIPTIVSLNTIMVDGTGMCGGCRVTVGNETKFVCVDGPEFDGHKVDFDGMIKRLKAYKKIEDEKHHECHIKLNIK